MKGLGFMVLSRGASGCTVRGAALAPGPLKPLALVALIWRLERLFLFWVYET